MKFLRLFFYRPFLGINIAQFFDTLGNNFLRNAITAAVIFRIICVNNSIVVSSLMVGILMLPSFLFMATAGEIADKYPKDMIIKILKILQLFATVLACLGFAYQNIWILLISLFCMGTFAAFLSTAKYSILPEILPQNKLLAANSIIQVMVFLAILSGTILGGLIFSVKSYILYGILLATAVIGVIFAFIIPPQTNCSPKSVVHKNLLTAMIKNISFMLGVKGIISYIITISWFWLVGTIIVSIIPTFTKEIIHGNDSIFTMFIVLFTIGLSLGTILCQSISKEKVSDRFVLPCLFVIILSLLDLSYAAANYTATKDITTIKSFIYEWQGIHIISDIIIFSVAGGIYIVPLITMLQILAPTEAKAKIIASNNIINALFMIVGSGICALLLLIKASVPLVFFILSCLNICAFALFWLKNIFSKNKRNS